MKGKKVFTQREVNEISILIDEKLKVDTQSQKEIRNKIRELGFYSKDFGMGPGYGYTVNDFLSAITISK